MGLRKIVRRLKSAVEALHTLSASTLGRSETESTPSTVYNEGKGAEEQGGHSARLYGERLPSSEAAGTPALPANLEGRTLRHNSFGIGRVISTKNDRLVVDFGPPHGVKKFLHTAFGEYLFPPNAPPAKSETPLSPPGRDQPTERNSKVEQRSGNDRRRVDYGEAAPSSGGRTSPWLPDWAGRVGQVVRFRVVGVTYDGRQARVRQASVGMRIRLLREPNNPHDRNAIAVMGSHGQLGYVPRSLAQALAPCLDRHDEYVAQVSSVLGGGDLYTGLQVDLYIRPSDRFSPIADGTTVELITPSSYGVPTVRIPRRSHYEDFDDYNEPEDVSDYADYGDAYADLYVDHFDMDYGFTDYESEDVTDLTPEGMDPGEIDWT